MAETSAVALATTLVPSAVAALAMVITASQNKWQRTFSDRQQRLAIQQLNLTLLDRRVKALAVVQSVIARYHDTAFTENRTEQLFPIIHEGSAIFSPAIAQRLKDAWDEQVKIHNLRIDDIRALPGDPDKEQRRQSIEDRRIPFVDVLKALHTDMMGETRIVEA